MEESTSRLWLVGLVCEKGHSHSSLHTSVQNAHARATQGHLGTSAWSQGSCPKDRISLVGGREGRWNQLVRFGRFWDLYRFRGCLSKTKRTSLWETGS